MLAVTTVVMKSLSFAYGQAQDARVDLDLWLQEKKYVELEHFLGTKASELPPSDLTYFEGVMANRTNQVRRSSHLLEPLLPALLAGNSARAEIALCTLADDYAKSFRYKDASGTYAAAGRLAEQQGKASVCSAGGESSRWHLLSDAPVQTVNGVRSFTVEGRRDSLGLFQIQITARNYTGSWIVDSGASLSVISRSAATKMGLEVSPIANTAEGTASLPVSVHTAVIPEMRIEKAIVRNVAVLVVEDSNLAFPDINYHIEGSLGLPVLSSFHRVTFYPGGQLRFNQTKDTDKKGDSHNLFFESSGLLATADFGHGTQLFSLDTGALLTVLSAQFYRDNKDTLGAGDWAWLQLEGAGGSLESPAYILRELRANLGGGCAVVRRVPVLTEPSGLSNEFYGNIGQSALSSFSSFTLDFDTMRFSVTGGIECSTASLLARRL